MSGGVDSSVAAYLLKKEGYELTGAYMKNWLNEDEIIGECPWKEDMEDARKVAEVLNIDFKVVNFIKDYKSKVVDYLLEEYSKGITPNPDIMCNKEIKFGLFLKHALDNGFDGIATGHYAKIISNKDGSNDIYKAKDDNKNQSYFLALLKQNQIKNVLFPLGDLLKNEVRQIADEVKLPNCAKKDSQGICFIGKIKMRDFLKNYLKENKGDIVDIEGKKVGEHEGLHYYTLGQRRGIKVASNQYKKAYVVVDKIIEKNQLVVDIEEKDAFKLYSNRCEINSLSFTNGFNSLINKDSSIQCQVRYRSECVDSLINYDSINNSAEVRFLKEQRALSPGQICAIYDKNKLVGGGVFKKIYYDNVVN